jgi:DNA-binding NarL/FixJ family response regulator
MPPASSKASSRIAQTGATVAIRSEDGPLTERITGILGEAGCTIAGPVDEQTRVVISTHRRIGQAVCAEVRKLAASSSERVVILVVEQVRAGDVRRALQAGAQAVVTHGSIESALAPSIGAALAGQISIPARTGAKGAPQLLTNREKQVLGLVVMGMTNAAIASKLYLAESTVKSHLSSAFAKLGVSSRSEAATVILDPESGTGLGILTIPTQ